LFCKYLEGCADASMICRYRRKRAKLVERSSAARLPTTWGPFTAYCYRSFLDGIEHIAMVKVSNFGICVNVIFFFFVAEDDFIFSFVVKCRFHYSDKKEILKKSSSDAS